MRYLRKLPGPFLVMFLWAVSAYAGTQGHYYPGVMGNRDIILPPKGFYSIFYDPFYYSSDFRNSDGNSVTVASASVSETKYINVRGHHIPITLSDRLSADVDMSMTFAMQQLLLLWVSGWKVIGADFGMMVVPSMGYVNVNVEAKAHNIGTISIGNYSKSVSKDTSVKMNSSIYGFGDMLIQPIMLDWRSKRCDVGFYYGFFAPTGAYSEDRAANVGMGFWSQQLQGWAAYYFDDKKKTAATMVCTYNLNSKMYDQDLAPGQSITIEYGLDHYFNDRASLGICGYDQWQVSSDSGTAAKNKSVFYQIHGIGGQVSGWILKEKLNFTGKFIYEYYGVDRFRGILATGNIIFVF